MLTTAEIVKKVRELEIKSKKLTSNLFTGEYHSAFKGRGMSFKEVREYAPGDDVRFIDWNVSAKGHGTFVKTYKEEKEQSGGLLSHETNHEPSLHLLPNLPARGSERRIKWEKLKDETKKEGNRISAPK